jgi:predicted TIM-barrel fold metal-dependent hydrolase
LAANKQWVGIRIGNSIFVPNAPRAFNTVLPNVMTNLAFAAKQGLEIDTLGISVAVLSQIGAATPGLTIVMDHFAGKPTTFDVEDSWKADMLTAASYAGLNIKVSDVNKLSSQVVTGLARRLKTVSAGCGSVPLCADPRVPVENHWRRSANLRHQLAGERCRRPLRRQHRPGD